MAYRLSAFQAILNRPNRVNLPQAGLKHNFEQNRFREDEISVLNLYFSSTGNTEKLTKRLDETVRELDCPVDTVKVVSKEMPPDILDCDFIFVGVYGQLPGKRLNQAKQGD